MIGAVAVQRFETWYGVFSPRDATQQRLNCDPAVHNCDPAALALCEYFTCDVFLCRENKYTVPFSEETLMYLTHYLQVILEFSTPWSYVALPKHYLGLCAIIFFYPFFKTRKFLVWVDCIILPFSKIIPFHSIFHFLLIFFQTKDNMMILQMFSNHITVDSEYIVFLLFFVLLLMFYSSDGSPSRDRN